jgi:hypothetical protein
MALMAGEWGLHPERIGVPVTVWQGELDTTARELAATVPGCVAHFLPYDGHLSILPGHGRSILSDLVV